MKYPVLTGVALSALIVQPALAKSKTPLTGMASFVDCSENTHQFFALGALAGVVIGPLVEAGIKGLGNALASAGAPKEAHILASTSDLFYGGTLPTPEEKKFEGMKLTSRHGCVVVAAGTVNRVKPVVLPATANDVFGSGLPFLQENQFDGRPSFFMQGQIEIAQDRSAWRWNPTFLWIGKPLADSSWASGSGRDIVVSLSVHGVSASADEGVIAARSITLRRVENDSSLHNSNGIPGLATGWMPLPALSEATAARVASAVQRVKDIKALQAARSQYLADATDAAKPAPERKTAATNAGKATMQIDELIELSKTDITALEKLAPVTFTFDVHETRDGNKFLAALGKALARNAKELATPIADRLDPAKRTEAAIKAGNDQDALRVAALNAIDAWHASVDAKESSAKQTIAKIGAAGACRTLQLRGLADPACLELIS